MKRYNVGDRIQNRYQVYKIFEGGFGVVYICYDHQEHVPLAIKGFKEEFALNEKVIERFRREALEWVELERHQNIVRAYYVEVIEGRPYIFLEYIAGAEGVGSNLDSWIEHGRVDYKRALKFAVHIANGMDYAFRKRNLVHRDLKPQNILVTSDETAKVTDFGLAKSVMEGGEKIFPSSALGEKKEKSLLIDGGCCGTPPYMPPEQWGNAENADTRADIYGFGCVLYEMLTGEPPFASRRSLQALRQAHLNERPKNPKAKNPSVSGALDKLVMKCLEKKPQKRYDSFAHLRDELQGVYKREMGEEILLEVEPSALEVWELSNKGVALNNLERYQEAIDCFDRALEINPRDAETWCNKGSVLGRMGQHQEALGCADSAIEIKPRYDTAWYNKGVTLNNLGQHQEAIDCFDRALEINPRYDNAWNNKGVALAKLERHQEAINCYEQAIEINPRHAEAWCAKGSALGKLGGHQEAIGCCERAIEINPRFALALSNKGLALTDLGQYQKGIACCDKAIEINPRLIEAWCNKGVALNNLGRHQEAIECFDRAIEINPGDAIAWRNKSATLERMGQYREAIDCADRAIEIDPRDAVAWFNKSVPLYYLHRYEEAIECADRVIEINPALEEAHELKMICLDALRRG